MLSAAWQNEPPTPGNWWVAIHPDARKKLLSDEWVRPVTVSHSVIDMHGFLFPHDHDVFKGARWSKRETPADPFAADREPVTPRAGQVWQKLNVGFKTASSAPRITVIGQSLDMVSIKNEVGQIRRMRITTLQRDWHCLNP